MEIKIRETRTVLLTVRGRMQPSKEEFRKAVESQKDSLVFYSLFSRVASGSIELPDGTHLNYEAYEVDEGQRQRELLPDN